MIVQSDLLILASAIVPQKNNPLAQLYKVPQNADGFFAEAHVKLRPNDFATDGVFVCGLAHAPKPIDESIAQAQAAASRAVTVLSALEISVSGTVALVDPNTCSQCGVCVAVCPYSAPKFNANFRQGRNPGNPVQGLRAVRGILQIRRPASQRI